MISASLDLAGENIYRFFSFLSLFHGAGILDICGCIRTPLASDCRNLQFWNRKEE